MYIHLVEDTVVRDREIIGIFDIENTSVGKHTKNFLNRSGKQNKIYTVSYEMPRSFIVCSSKEENETVYISQISAATLKKRAERSEEKTILHGGF